MDDSRRCSDSDIGDDVIPVYPIDVLARRQYRNEARWIVSNVAVDWFGVILRPGTAFLAYETVLYTVVVIGCPMAGCRIAYSKKKKNGNIGFPIAFGTWIRHIHDRQKH